jgi:hypothetical protein
MINFGILLTILLVQLIMLKLDNILINNVFGFRNRCLKVVLLELNVIHKLLYRILLKVTQILLIHQNKLYRFVL